MVEIAAAQDVGRLLNPQGAEGQVEGATAMGLGLALMEEVKLDHGIVRNPSFTDYLIPTMVDVPHVVTEFVEVPDPDTPYGVKGIGELGTVVATPAVVAALRAATGFTLNRAPVSPDELVGLRGPAVSAGPAPVPVGPDPARDPGVPGMGVGQQHLMKGNAP